jgi:CHAT domain-containing protein
MVIHRVLFLLALLCFCSAAARCRPGGAEPAVPEPSAPVRGLLKRAADAAATRRPAKALALSQQARGLAGTRRDLPGMARAAARSAEVLEATERVPAAVCAWQDAAQAWHLAGNGPGEVEALLEAARLSTGTPRETTVRRALSLAAAERRRPVAVAQVLMSATEGFFTAEDLDICTRLNEVAVAKLHTERPDSALEADALGNLGTVAHARGDFDKAERYLEKALDIDRRRVPGSVSVATDLNNLALVARDRGDLAKARRYHLEALAIDQAKVPGTHDEAIDLANLGLVARDEGDLEQARRYFLLALEIDRRVAPGSRSEGIDLNNLGLVAHALGDLPQARRYYEQALVLKRRHAPHSLTVAVTLANLGAALRAQGELELARFYLEEALAIRRAKAPGSLDEADSLSHLAVLAQARGDLDGARRLVEQAVAIEHRRAPGSCGEAVDVESLGVLGYEKGDLREARRHFQQALEVYRSKAPDSLHEARCLHRLSKVALRERHFTEALEFAQRSWTLFRRQASSVRGDEARQAYVRTITQNAAQLLECQLILGQPNAALVTLEQSRAQALQQLLVERSLDLHLAPEALTKRYSVARRRRETAEAALASVWEGYARQRRQLGLPERPLQDRQDPRFAREQDPQLLKAEAQRRDVENAFAAAREEVDAAFAAVQEAVARQRPSALLPAENPEDARRALPAGAVYLAFSAGEEKTFAFLVSGDSHQPVRVFTAALGGKEAAARVAELRSLLEAEATGARALAGERLVALQHASRSLAGALLPSEAWQEIQQAKQVVLCPDGPLWDLPFAALVLPDSAGNGVRYLGLAKPLTYTPSLTFFARILSAPAGEPGLGGKLAALVIGDPLVQGEKHPAVPTGAAATGSRRTVSRRPGPQGAASRAAATPRVRIVRDTLSGIDAAREPVRAFTVGGVIPPPLPRAAEEAQEVARLYGTAPALGALPTEGWFRRHAPGKQVLHLATHGYFNRFRAMSSALALAAPQALPGKRMGKPAAGGEVTGDDGVLQAWELVSMKLPAELAVLSACETAQGEKVQGEGLVGLTRALQVAGVRSVVASQWAVKEGSTKALMVAFHRGLRAGLPKDEALQQAGQSVAKQAGWENPYYWSAFLLTGDPRNGGLAAPER